MNSLARYAELPRQLSLGDAGSVSRKDEVIPFLDGERNFRLRGMSVDDLERCARQTPAIF